MIHLLTLCLGLVACSSGVAVQFKLPLLVAAVRANRATTLMTLSQAVADGDKLMTKLPYSPKAANVLTLVDQQRCCWLGLAHLLNLAKFQQSFGGAEKAIEETIEKVSLTTCKLSEALLGAVGSVLDPQSITALQKLDRFRVILNKRALAKSKKPVPLVEPALKVWKDFSEDVVKVIAQCKFSRVGDFDIVREDAIAHTAQLICSIIEALEGLIISEFTAELRHASLIAKREPSSLKTRSAVKDWLFVKQRRELNESASKSGSIEGRVRCVSSTLIEALQIFTFLLNKSFGDQSWVARCFEELIEGIDFESEWSRVGLVDRGKVETVLTPANADSDALKIRQFSAAWVKSEVLFIELKAFLNSLA